MMFRICQISIQGTHLHMLVETASQEALSRGMPGFLVSCARRLNAAARRQGRVFADQQLAQARRGPRRPAAPRSDELGRHARGLVDGAVTSRGRRAHDAGLVARDVALARGLAARRNDLAVGAPRARVIADERRGAIE
jgi:hypothetical protein